MIWIILVIAVIIIACYIAYKYGEVHELHKARAAFEHYLELHESLKERLGPGIEAAEAIIDQIEEEDTLW